MEKQKDWFKRLHPDQFSDTKITKRAQLGRDFLEYHLSKISSHSQEKDFERFCKAILEAEVCPNLLTQTGPTGGGDSKVDTETYPVSEQIAESWLSGYANNAHLERWAFAISAKADWRAKVQSDVEKIVKTNNDGRCYTRIFFVSNQHISDKNRASVEDTLRKKYDIDIRIYNIDWLLDAVFRNDKNRLTAVKTLGLSENLVDEKQIGENDYRRRQEIERIEHRLLSINDLRPPEIVQLAKRSVILSRQLEVDIQNMLSLIERYIRLSKQYGTVINQVDALYDSAWTVYWWYSDNTLFYHYYTQLETIAATDNNLYLFEKLCTLWINLFAITKSSGNTAVNLDQHRELIEGIYRHLISDSNKPNTVLAAKTSYQLIRPARGDSIDEIVNEYIDIIKNSENSLEVDISSIAQVIQNVSIYQEAENYDALFEAVVTRVAKERHDSEASRMNVLRGYQLVEKEPYKALAYYSKAVLGFHNEENAFLLMVTVFNMARLLESLGLWWAARNYYYYVVSFCLNAYMKRGEITSYFAVSANRLKWIELHLGRIMFSVEMQYVETIARAFCPEDVPTDNIYFDNVLSHSLFDVSFEQLHSLSKLPNYLYDKGLPLSSAVIKYELGHYDTQLLNELNGDRMAVDKHMQSLASNSFAEQENETPWFGFEGGPVLQSRIMGCIFRIRTQSDLFSIEFASTLLASLECFLGSAFQNDLLSRASSFEIEVFKNQNSGFEINVEYNRENPTNMTIWISEYNESDFQTAQKKHSEKTIEIISTIVSALLTTNDDFRKLKEMIENECVFARSQVFTNSLFYGFSTFGPEAFSYENLTKELEGVPLLRNKKVALKDIHKACVKEEIPTSKVVFDEPPKSDFKQCKNNEIVMSEIINIPLWDVSKWKGVLYFYVPGKLPGLSLLFENESGIKIFDEWMKRIGDDDVNNEIGIRIIKGIDADHQSWYRVGIGANHPFSNHDTTKLSVIISPCRMHTMQPATRRNLETFQKIQLKTGAFFLCPSIIDNNGSPKPLFEKNIIKHAESIIIQNAYEIDEQDFIAEAAILPTDNPIIPEGMEHCPLSRILKRKRTH